MAVTRSRRSETTLPIAAHPIITNIVCGMNLNCHFDLPTIAIHCRNVEYRPRKFPAAVMRLREPKTTALVFEKGKMQLLGARSIDDAKLAAPRFARMLQKLGFKPRLDDFVVQNIVAHARTNMLVRLEGLQHKHRYFARYEPEIFSGLVYKIMEPKMTALIFSKGKVVLLGAKTREDLDEAMRKLYPAMLEFKIADV